MSLSYQKPMTCSTLNGIELSQANYRHLLPPSHSFDPCLALKCRTVVRMSFLVDDCDRATAAGVSGSSAGVVLQAATAHVLGDARVERAIGTTHDINEPCLGGRFGFRLAVPLWHQDKIRAPVVVFQSSASFRRVVLALPRLGPPLVAAALRNRLGRVFLVEGVRHGQFTEREPRSRRADFSHVQAGFA